MNTFSDLLTELQAYDPALPLIFETDEGEIGAGYHVTELRHSISKGIDCGGNISSWRETRLQLLDGEGAEHMSVGKFTGIVRKSLASLPDLADAPLLVEFGHGNNGLMLLSPGAPAIKDSVVVVPLGDARAVCKPALRISVHGVQTGACCAGAEGATSKTACCLPVAERHAAHRCCA